MSLDESDYRKLKEIESDLNSIKVELKEHNRLMAEIIVALNNLMVK